MEMDMVEMDEVDEHVVTKRRKRRALSTSGAVLDAFWKLASYNEKERAQTTFRLIDILKKEKAQSNEQESSSPQNLNYSVERLVKGLSSNRKAARIGYYVALVEILRTFPQVHVKSVKKLINKHLLPGDNNNASPIQLEIGRTVAYASLIRSRKIENNGAFIEKVVNYLVDKCFPKSQLSTFCAILLVEIFLMVDENTFSAHVLPKLQEMFVGWESCTQDVLYLLINARERFSKIINKKFLQNHFTCKKIIDVETCPYIHAVLVQPVDESPTLHPVWNQVIEITVNSEFETFSTLWKSVLGESNFKSPKQQFLAFEVLNILLPKLTSPDQISIVLPPHVMKEFIRNVSHKEMKLHKTSERLLQSIEKYMKDASAECQLELIKKLIQEPGSVLLDHIVSKKPLQTISAMLQEGAVIGFSELLKDIFLAQKSRTVSDATREEALKKLANLVGQRNMVKNTSWRVSILQFLALHAFFDVKCVSSKVPHCNAIPSAVSSKLHLTAQGAFFKGLASLPTLHTTGNISTLQAHFSMLHSVLLFVGQLIDNPKLVSNLQSWDDKTMKVWKNLLASVQNLTARAELDGRNSESHAFQVLFLHMGLQLFVLPEKACEALEELQICNSKAMDSRQKPKKKSHAPSDDDEPKWSEVVLDLLLGLLSENKSFLRTVVDNVFSLLLPFVPQTALDHILKLIDPEMADETILEENDSEDSDSPLDDDAETESETASSTVDNQSVDELRASVEAALGDAVGNSEDETYLNDDAMESLDDALSEAFRSLSGRHKKTNKPDEALLHFRQRCVDLLNIVVSSDMTLPTAAQLLLPLVSTVEACTRDKSLVQLTNRVSGCLRKLVNLKKFNTDCDPQLYDTCRETIVNSTRSMIKRSYRVTNVEFNKLVADVFVFLYRCAIQLDKLNDGNSEKMVDSIADILKQALVDFLGQRGMRVHQTIFFALLHHYKELGWKLCETIEKYTFNSETRLFMQTNALAMLNVITSQANVANPKQWKKFSDTHVQNIEKAVQDLAGKDIKPKHLMELLTLWRNIFKINTVLQREVTISVEMQEALQQIGPVAKSQKKLINQIFRLAKLPHPTAIAVENIYINSSLGKRSRNQMKRSSEGPMECDEENETMETEDTPSPKKKRLEHNDAPSTGKKHRKRKGPLVDM